MPIEKPNLTEAQPGAPITASDWNAMIRAVKELQATLQNLRTRAPAGILVTVRDRDTENILPPELIAAVYAVSVAINTLMQPGRRTGGDQAYLIPIDAPGEYEVTVEPMPESGYQQQTQRIAVSEDIALVDFLLWEQPREPVVPMVFGKTLREARAVLEVAGIPLRRMLDAHGEAIDPEVWEADFGNRLVVGTEPGAGMVISGNDTVDILVAGRVEPVERKPVLVGQIPVARPTRLALSPDGSLLYVLGQGSARGGGTAITVVDTRRRRVITTIEAGTTPLLNLAFHPSGERAFVSVILPEFTLAGALTRSVELARPTLGPVERIGSPGLDLGRSARGEERIASSVSLGQRAAAANAITAAAMLGRGSALNQLIIEAGTGAAFAAGIANLAAVNLAAALGTGVKARGDQGAIVIVDAARHRVIPGALIPTPVCYGLDVSADGQSLYGASPTQRRAVRVDLRTGQVAQILAEGGPAFVDVVGEAVHITDVARHLLLRLSATGETQSFRAGISPLDLAISPDGRFAYVVNFNLQTGSLVRVNLVGEFNVPPEAIPGVSPRVVNQDGFLLSGIDITPDGQHICVTIDEGLAIVNVGTLAVQTVSLGGEPAGVVIEPRRADGSGGKYAYVANFGDNVVQIVDLTGEDEPFVRTTFTGTVFTGRVAELMTVPGVNEHVAERLVLSGIQSISDLANANTSLVASALEVNPIQAAALIGRAGRLALTLR
ncbi:MAG: hypothetical protein RML36_09260 [Anaerolineae bacterium]|nr:hypothetical protein [Anaerolineae bacterium]MDW8099654.1 hypothetical protein [Anaerolineae bacterium]